MRKLLYINNYNCCLSSTNGLPDNHLWGADKLVEHFKVKAAHVPELRSIKNHQLQVLLRNIYLAIRYYNFPIVYSACGELTYGFALFRKIKMWNGKLIKLQHSGFHASQLADSYDKIIYISPTIYKAMNQPNSVCIEWGGDISYAKECMNNSSNEIEFDFISAGKSYRDHSSMIKAAENINAKSLIITDVNRFTYDSDITTIISGESQDVNSLDDRNVYKSYLNSRFIVIPCIPFDDSDGLRLVGLTTFVDAVVLGKPVLISDNTSIGVDVEKYGIGLFYKAGDVSDMSQKMTYLKNLTECEYTAMCDRMRSYSKTHNYEVFKMKILDIISSLCK